MSSFTVSAINTDELKEALDLVLKVFMKFEAPCYSKLGVETFVQFINYESIKSAVQNGGYKMWICKNNGQIIGVIATRSQNHISLFFVDESYHRQGAGKLMFNTVLESIKQLGISKMTVNSSPYAVEVYRRLGFVDTDIQKTENGITYTPMEIVL